jgi:expansin (peptidoglycan-binding protein)
MLSFYTIILFFLIITHLVNSSPIAKRSSYNGKATWFIPSKHGGSWGACRRFEADDAMIVAMNADQYGDMNRVSKMCGKSVRIWYRGRSTVAVVNDACPKCRFGDLDLTPPVFRALGRQSVGVLDIHWEFV